MRKGGGGTGGGGRGSGGRGVREADRGGRERERELGGGGGGQKERIICDVTMKQLTILINLNSVYICVYLSICVPIYLSIQLYINKKREKKFILACHACFWWLYALFCSH